MKYWSELLALVIAGFWLFMSLGDFTLWSDEADTALFAQGVRKTGDMTAQVGHNLNAFRNGSMLRNLCNRYLPPLPYYFLAPFITTENTDAWWPRAPFAALGLITVAILLVWARRATTSGLSRGLFQSALLCNVSFFLYARQSRYYALATVLSVGIAYLYINWQGRTRTLVAISLLSLALLATQYLNYAALCAVLLIDYVLWKRHERPLSGRQWIVLLGPQLILGALIAYVFNPLSMNVVTSQPKYGAMMDKLVLFWRNLRDINTCQFGLGWLMLLAPLLYLKRRDPWLLRGSAALVAYVVCVTLLSPQPLSQSDWADIRYLQPIIPLCVFLTVLALLQLTGRRALAAIPLAAVVFGTNVLHFPTTPRYWQSTPALFAHELLVPHRTATSLAVDWINKNVEQDQSVWVMPDDRAFPLMYHAPQAIYAWQLDPPPRGQFSELPKIHFKFEEPVDYVIVFGPVRRKVERKLDEFGKRGLVYEQFKRLKVHYDELTRPELFFHAFGPAPVVEPDLDEVYFYRRVSPADSQPAASSR